MRGFYLATANQLPLTTDNSILITLVNSSLPTVVHGYVFDNGSTWGQGAYWLANTTDSNTYGIPGTSDRTLAIGTWLADFPIPPRVAGELWRSATGGTATTTK